METVILELEVLAQHLDLVMVGCCSLPSGSCQASKRSDSVGGFPRSAYSVLLRFRRSRSHEAPSKAESGVATSNYEVSSDEQSTKSSGAALIKEPPWASQPHNCCDSCRTKKNHFSTKTPITTTTDSTFAPSEVLTNCPTVGFLNTRDLAY